MSHASRDTKHLLSGEDILGSRMKPIEVWLEDGTTIQLRGLTGADADWLISLERQTLGARDKIVHLLTNQIQSPLTAETGVAGWSDRQLMTAFRVWAADHDTLEVEVEPDADFDHAVIVISRFVKRWTKDSEQFASTPIATLISSMRMDGFGRFPDLLGLDKIGYQLRDLERAVLGCRLDPPMLVGIIEEMRIPEFARRLEVPVSLTNQLTNLIVREPPPFPHSSMLEILGVVEKAARTMGEQFSRSALSMTRTTLLMESALAGLEWRIDGSHQVVPADLARSMRAALRDHVTAYGDLVSELGIVTPHLEPRLAYELPAIEAFNEVELARVWAGETHDEDPTPPRLERRAEIRDELEADLPKLLRELKPSLPRLWDGARNAIQSGNVDRARHVMASLRTLVDDVLDILAPHEAVKAIASPTDLLADGRVKRAARLRYLGRKLEFGRLERAFAADMLALSELYSALNALHDSKLFVREEELWLLMMRVGNGIHYAILASKL